jgi:hypothetical protein
MAKNDPQPKEDIKRGQEDEPGSLDINSRNQNQEDEESAETTIRNANASGVGAMGRNDQNQMGDTSNHSGNGGKE